jgi:HSP20 family protein
LKSAFSVITLVGKQCVSVCIFYEYHGIVSTEEVIVMVNLALWREQKEFDRFRNEMDRLFDQFFDLRQFRRPFLGGEWMPSVDITETEKEVVFNAELPGLSAEDMEISLHGRVLTIKGEKRHRQEEKTETYHLVERRYGTFTRSFELPLDVQGDKVKSRYEDGVLNLRFPKSGKRPVTKIEIKAS